VISTLIELRRRGWMSRSHPAAGAVNCSIALPMLMMRHQTLVPWRHEIFAVSAACSGGSPPRRLIGNQRSP
jgi:hypothetical protein